MKHNRLKERECEAMLKWQPRSWSNAKGGPEVSMLVLTGR